MIYVNELCIHPCRNIPRETFEKVRLEFEQRENCMKNNGGHFGQLLRLMLFIRYFLKVLGYDHVKDLLTH